MQTTWWNTSKWGRKYAFATLHPKSNALLQAAGHGMAYSFGPKGLDIRAHRALTRANAAAWLIACGN